MHIKIEKQKKRGVSYENSVGTELSISLANCVDFISGYRSYQIYDKKQKRIF